MHKKPTQNRTKSRRKNKTKIINNENSLTTIEEKDLLDRTVELRKEDDNKNILFLEKYEYDSSNNKTCIIKYIQKGNQNIETKERFEYDAFNRLLKHIDPLNNETITIYNENYKNDLDQLVLQKITIDPVNLKTIEIFNTSQKIHCLQKEKDNKKI